MCSEKKAVLRGKDVIKMALLELWRIENRIQVRTAFNIIIITTTSTTTTTSLLG